MVHLFLDRQGSEIKLGCIVKKNPKIQCSRYPIVDPAECHSLGNSCSHSSVSSYLHLFEMAITVAAKIVLWQDVCCPGLYLHSCH
ncbi:hypothetical protein XELAEV_18015932mg [Xenopus laevis]|uniref:Uncharacterized protein n=2 Tax=Xenopus laevis TaxID=8355 RepID=A0A974GYE7_XENLA|nr:hypothetical protein XELAEV_18004268mg [Xenopus laevis]OCT92866.1 hypothetical protein XELAEV_18015932mg [Xenopus laevis]